MKPIESYSLEDYEEAMMRNPILYELYKRWRQHDAEVSFSRVAIAGCVILATQVAELEKMAQVEISNTPHPLLAKEYSDDALR